MFHVKHSSKDIAYATNNYQLLIIAPLTQILLNIRVANAHIS